MALNTLESKIKYRISRSKDDVFVLKDFDDLSDRDQISRALRKLAEQDGLVKISRGMYAKTRIARRTGNTILSRALSSVATDGLKKLGVGILQAQAERDYNAGKTTQVPTGNLIAVDRRVSRKIEYDGYEVEYEYGPR